MAKVLLGAVSGGLINHQRKLGDRGGERAQVEGRSADL